MKMCKANALNVNNFIKHPVWQPQMGCFILKTQRKQPLIKTVVCLNLITFDPNY